MDGRTWNIYKNIYFKKKDNGEFFMIYYYYKLFSHDLFFSFKIPNYLFESLDVTYIIGIVVWHFNEVDY